MSAKAERFAERIQKRMRDLGLRTHDDVEEAGGQSSPTMTTVLNARSDVLSPTTAKKLEAALHLERGSASLSFEDDVELVPAERFSTATDTDELRAEIARPAAILETRGISLVVSEALGERQTKPSHPSTLG